MSDLVTITEVCRCECSTTITMPTRGDAEALVDKWRAAHPCMDRALLDAQARGGPTESATVLGFHRQWDHDTAPPVT
jgi:hypothetical protein